MIREREREREVVGLYFKLEEEERQQPRGLAVRNANLSEFLAAASSTTKSTTN